MDLTDTEAERQVIGTLLLDSEQVTEAMALLDASDFGDPQYNATAAAIFDLSIENQPITLSTVAQKLKDRGGDGWADTQLLTHCMEGVSVGELPFWAERVNTSHVRRRMYAAGTRIRELAEEGAEPERAEELIFGVVHHGSAEVDFATPKDAMATLHQRLDKYMSDPDALTGVGTGWKHFDRALDGLRPGEVTVLYAPTSRFKSVFAMNLLWRLARQNVPGVWFTTEMPRLQVMERLLGLEAGVNIRDKRFRHELFTVREQLDDAMLVIEDYPIVICDRTNLTLASLRSHVRRLKRWRSVEYVVVDLADHITTGDSRHSETQNESRVAIGLKAIAKENQVHILATAHIKKPFDSSKLPAVVPLEMLKGSSSKYQDADNTMSLMPVKMVGNPQRPNWESLTDEEFYRTKSPLDWAGYRKESWYVYTMLGFTKVREGETPQIPMFVDLHGGMRMEEYTP